MLARNSRLHRRGPLGRGGRGFAAAGPSSAPARPRQRVTSTKVARRAPSAARTRRGLLSSHRHEPSLWRALKPIAWPPPLCGRPSSRRRPPEPFARSLGGGVDNGPASARRDQLFRPGSRSPRSNRQGEQVGSSRPSARRSLRVSNVRGVSRRSAGGRRSLSIKAIADLPRRSVTSRNTLISPDSAPVAARQQAQRLAVSIQAEDPSLAADPVLAIDPQRVTSAPA